MKMYTKFNLSAKRLLCLLLLFVAFTIKAEEDNPYMEVVKSNFIIIKSLNNSVVLLVEFSGDNSTNTLSYKIITSYKPPSLQKRYCSWIKYPSFYSDENEKKELRLKGHNPAQLKGLYYIFGKVSGNIVTINNYIEKKRFDELCLERTKLYKKQFLSVNNFAHELTNNYSSFYEKVISDFSLIEKNINSVVKQGVIQKNDTLCKLIFPNDEVFIKQSSWVNFVDGEKIIFSKKDEQASSYDLYSLNKVKKIFNPYYLDMYLKFLPQDSIAFKSVAKYELDRVFGDILWDQIWKVGLVEKEVYTSAESAHYDSMIMLGVLAGWFKQNKEREKFITKIIFWGNEKKFEWFAKNIDKLIKNMERLHKLKFTTEYVF